MKLHDVTAYLNKSNNYTIDRIELIVKLKDGRAYLYEAPDMVGVTLNEGDSLDVHFYLLNNE